MSNPDGTKAPCCKVGDVATECELTDLDDTLRERWTAAENSTSLRDLAHYVNERVLASMLSEGHRGTLAGEVENYYRLLTDDDASRGMRIEATNRLGDRGVDVEELETRFVSHQTVYRHLTDCLDVTREERATDSATAVRDGIGTIRALQRRTEVVASSTLERLERAGHFHIEEINVLVDVRISCRACGGRLELSESLVGQTCDCDG